MVSWLRFGCLIFLFFNICIVSFTDKTHTLYSNSLAGTYVKVSKNNQRTLLEIDWYETQWIVQIWSLLSGLSKIPRLVKTHENPKFNQENDFQDC